MRVWCFSERVSHGGCEGAVALEFCVPLCASLLPARPELVEQPQAGVVGLRALRKLPAALRIENHRAPASLAAQVVRVVRRVGIIQETERVRQEWPGGAGRCTRAAWRGDAAAGRAALQRGARWLSSRVRERRKNGTGGG